MTTLAGGRLIEIIPVTRCSRQLTSGIPRPVCLVGSVLVSPCPNFVEVTACMRSAHSVDTDAGEDLKGGVASAHDGLSNVVEAMIAVEDDILRWHCGNALGVICEAEEVLRNKINHLSISGVCWCVWTYQAMELMKHGDSVYIWFGLELSRERLGKMGGKLSWNRDDSITS